MPDTPSASPSRTRRAARGPVIAGAVLLVLLAALVAGLQLTYRPLPPPGTASIDLPAAPPVDTAAAAIPPSGEAEPPVASEPEAAPSPDAVPAQAAAPAEPAAPAVPADAPPAGRDAAPVAAPGDAKPSGAPPDGRQALAPQQQPQPQPQDPGRAGPGAPMPWRHDARPFDDPQDRPRVAIVVYRLGLSQEETEAAIRHLPGEVTLAFSPYSRRLADWISAAAAAGHEALIQVPMEPIDYPADDPGPLTLLTAATARDNMQRLSAVLERANGTFGAMNHMGSRFTASPLHMRTVIEALATRGLAWVDARDSADTLGPRIATDAGVPTAYVNRVIDLQASRVSIDQRLAELERIARADGAAVGAAYPFPVTIERLGAWVNTLEAKGLVLAPVSAVLNRQRVP